MRCVGVSICISMYLCLRPCLPVGVMYICLRVCLVVRASVYVSVSTSLSLLCWWRCQCLSVSLYACLCACLSLSVCPSFCLGLSRYEAVWLSLGRCRCHVSLASTCMGVRLPATVCASVCRHDCLGCQSARVVVPFPVLSFWPPRSPLPAWPHVCVTSCVRLSLYHVPMHACIFLIRAWSWLCYPVSATGCRRADPLRSTRMPAPIRVCIVPLVRGHLRLTFVALLNQRVVCTFGQRVRRGRGGVARLIVKRCVILCAVLLLVRGCIGECNMFNMLGMRWKVVGDEQKAMIRLPLGPERKILSITSDSAPTIVAGIIRLYQAEDNPRFIWYLGVEGDVQRLRADIVTCDSRCCRIQCA